MKFDIKAYPIVYAIMPMYELAHWTESHMYDVRGYIVAKAYLVKRKTTYNFARYGKHRGHKSRFEVVFPFDISYPEVEKRDLGVLNEQEPDFDINDQCLNAVAVDNIFYCYNKAKKIARKMNDDMFLQEMSQHSLEDLEVNYDKYKEEFDIRIGDYDQYENILTQFSEKMEITSRYGRKLR